MKTIDCVKDQPQDKLELWDRWCNNIQSRCISMIGKKIEVKDAVEFDERVCPSNSRGRVICERNGEHSWFNHAMDGAY